MGSFNMSCGLSGASIDPGDKVMFIPLQHAKYAHSLKTIETIFEPFFEPSELPIYGIYNDYGELEDGTDIRDNGQCFLVDIVDKCIKRYKDSTILSDLPYPDLLKYIGFKFIKETDAIRYNQLYTYDKDPTIKAYSDGKWSNFTFGDTEHQDIYKFSKLLDLLNINKNDEKFNLPIRFFEYKTMNRDLEEARKNRNFVSSNPDPLQAELENKIAMLNSMNLQSKYFSSRNAHLFNRFLSDEEIKEVCKLDILYALMHCVHKYFFPNICGPQCGKREVEFIVFNESMNFSKSKIEEYEDDEDEDDE